MIHAIVAAVLYAFWLVVASGTTRETEPHYARFFRFALRVTALNLAVSFLLTLYFWLRLSSQTIVQFAKLENLALGVFTTLGDGNGLLQAIESPTVWDYGFHSLAMSLSSVTWALNVGTLCSAIGALLASTDHKK